MGHISHTWATGDVISANLLNSIESDLAGAAVVADISTAGTATGNALAAFVRRDDAKPPGSLLRAPAPASATLRAGDDFSGTAGTGIGSRPSTLGTASTWTEWAGAWHVDGSGHVSPTTGTDGLLATLALPSSVSATAYTVSADVVISKSGSASNAGALIFRHQSGSDFWYFQPPSNGGDDWTVMCAVAGAHTEKLRITYPKANGSTASMRVDLWGRDITVWLDGIEMHTIRNATHQNERNVGMRQGQSGGSTTPVIFSNFRVTDYAGVKLNLPRIDAAPSTQIVALGATGAFDDGDLNNPNITWDPINSRWVLYYSGFKAGSTGAIVQGMGLAYSTSLDGPWTKDPANPVVAATTNNVENGGLIYHWGRWLKVEDGTSWYTSPDLHTWTPITVTGISAEAGDPYLRVSENGVLECWYGVGNPTTAFHRATSVDGGLTWEDAEIVRVPSYFPIRGHGEPTVYVPPGREGREAMLIVDVAANATTAGALTAVVTVDAGATWHWHQLTTGSGSGFDSYQVFDSCPVWKDGIFHLFHAGGTVTGWGVNLNASIGHRAVQWSQQLDTSDSTHPLPYQ